jgi:hypothetical protein
MQPASDVVDPDAEAGQRIRPRLMSRKSMAPALAREPVDDAASQCRRYRPGIWCCTKRELRHHAVAPKRFQAKWRPVRARKTRQIMKRAPFRSIETQRPRELSSIIIRI